MKIYKLPVVLFLISFVITIAAAWIFLSSNQQAKNIMLKQGFDFHKLRAESPDFVSPKVGEKLDLENLKDADGKSPLSVSGEKLFLLIAIDPNCPACNFSMDMMSDIRRTTKDIKFAYYPILLTSIDSNTDIKTFIGNFGFENYFQWSSQSNMPNSLSSLMTPSHILVDNNGNVIQTWLGSSSDKNTRKIMGNQISSDLILIHDVYQAIDKNN